MELLDIEVIVLVVDVKDNVFELLVDDDVVVLDPDDVGLEDV